MSGIGLGFGKGAGAPAISKFCTNCGAPFGIHAAKFCGNCG